MCQACENIATEGLSTEALSEVDGALRDRMIVKDGQVFIDWDFVSATMSEVITTLQNIDDPFGAVIVANAGVVLSGFVSRARALAEVDALTAGVDVPEAPQNTSLF